MKPTEGEWKAEREEEFRFEITSQDDTHIATLDWHWSGEDPEFRELEANANLIAEAGTVYHETGLTPREILAQRDELLSISNEMHSDIACLRAILRDLGAGGTMGLKSTCRLVDLKQSLTQPA
jgi:hypothetical protein